MVGGTLPEKISYVTLMGLLPTNIFLILRKKKTVVHKQFN